MLGSFDNDNPYIEIEIKGVSGKLTKIKALVDTGYNGYLTLPYIEAFPLGLVLMGIESSIIADGSTSHHFVCIGTIKYDGKEVVSSIDIQPNCNILLGTKLLRLLEKTIVVDAVNKTIELVESKTTTPTKEEVSP